jgi:toxin ParE1/3/4
MTKPKLKWSPKAEEDLLDIYVTIGLENISAADRVYDKLKSKALTLIDAPRMGVERSDISLSARILIEKNYLIFYQIKSAEESEDVTDIEIIRIVDGRRDLKALFLKTDAKY